MKRIYKIIGILILVAIISIGCSEQDEAPESSEDTIEVEDNNMKDNEEEVTDEPEEGNEKTEDIDSEVKSKALRDMMNTEEYTMKLETTYEGLGNDLTKQTTTNVVTEDKTYLHTESDGTVINVIEKDGKSYLIMHDSKTVVVTSDYEGDEDEAVAVENIGFFDHGLEYLGEGKEDFLGNTRSYEEYDMGIGKVKYYFDGSEVDGAKMFIDMEAIMEGEEVEGMEFDDITMIMDILSFEEEVNESVFELPEDYELVGE